MKTLCKLQKYSVHKRRVRVLKSLIGPLLSSNAKVLDVGCGDGLLSKDLLSYETGITITGLDVNVRKETFIPVVKFDGEFIPFDNESFDIVMFIDVLHHTINPLSLLLEASRVTKKAIIIKDHILDGMLAYHTLCFMDWFGNAQHDVELPNNYMTREQWTELFNELKMNILWWNEKLNLYPIPADWIFGRSLHFISSLEKQ